MRLSALFSNGMVLQRDQENILWGYAKEGIKVRGIFAGKDFTVISGEEGYFEVILPEAPVGGPYELRISDGEEICIQDILVGDVFLLGGQSNMELPLRRTLDLYREELKDLEESEIRMFEVPKEYLFGAVREDIDHGSWIQAVGEEGMTLSAVGYFLAQAIREQKNVPIGLLQTAVGGTPIQAWCSENSLQEMGLYLEELEQCKDLDYVRNTIEKDCLLEQNWHREAEQGIASADKWTGEIVIPGLWYQEDLSDFHGSMLLEKKIQVTEAQCRCQAYLVLGAIVDADRVYVNGVLAGETGYKYPPRRYELPVGMFHAGENSIQIELYVFRENGGFIPGKSYEIIFGDDESRSVIELSGIWKYAIGKELVVLPNPTFFQYKASGLYNGIIYPIRKWNISGFLFYQGESNTDSPKGYSKMLEAVIGDWRALWCHRRQPFIYVQLAGFADAKQVCSETNWAVLREEQRKALEIPDTAMAVAFDAGEYNDLHPQDKKTVGYRLSLAVRRLVYGEEIVYNGPMYEGMESVLINAQEGEGIRVSFTHTGGGLQIGRNHQEKEEVTVLRGFELCSEDKIYVPAMAKIEGNGVLVWSKEIKKPRGVRYAWLNNPADANLYNVCELPASPFIAIKGNTSDCILN